MKIRSNGAGSPVVSGYTLAENGFLVGIRLSPPLRRIYDFFQRSPQRLISMHLANTIQGQKPQVIALFRVIGDGNVFKDNILKELKLLGANDIKIINCTHYSMQGNMIVSFISPD
jgi:hypothetical protein